MERRFISTIKIIHTVGAFVIIAITTIYLATQLRCIFGEYGIQHLTIYNFPSSQIERVRQEKLMEVSVNNIYFRYLSNGREFFVGSFSGYNLSKIEILEGRMPNGKNEITIKSTMAEILNINLGDVITMHSDNREIIYHVVGVADDFLCTQTVYSFYDRGVIVPDAIICPNENVTPSTTNLLVRFASNVTQERIRAFIDKYEVSGSYTYNEQVYDEDGKILFPLNESIMAIFYVCIGSLAVSLVVSLIMFRFLSQKSIVTVKYRLKTFWSMMYLTTLLASISLFAISLQSMRSELVNSDFSIKKAFSLTRGETRIPVNINDGLPSNDFNSIKQDNRIMDIVGNKRIQFNLTNLDQDMKMFFQELIPISGKDLFTNELGQYGYNEELEYFIAQVNFLDERDLLKLIEETTMQSIDMQKLQSGEACIIIVDKELDETLFASANHLYFKQVIDDSSIDLCCSISYVGKKQPRSIFADLFHDSVSVIMHSDVLKHKNIWIPYTDVSITVSRESDKKAVHTFLKSILDYGRCNTKMTLTYSQQQKDNVISTAVVQLTTMLVVTICYILLLSFNKRSLE